MNLETIIEKLSDLSDKIFYYGSHAVLKYKKRKTNIIRILSDINIADIARVVPDITYNSSLRSNCCCLLDGKLLLFYTRENNESNRVRYLKQVRRDENNNPFFNFFYSPLENKFLSIGTFYTPSKNTLSLAGADELHGEDYFDAAYLMSELDIEEMPEIPGYVNEYYFDYLPFKDLIEKLLTSANPYRALLFLHNTGMLEKVFPFLHELKGIEQDKYWHPEGDVFEHTLNCFRFVKNPSLYLAYGLLLHDYGKLYPEKSKRFKFFNHSSMGARFVNKILESYGYDAHFIEDIKFLVEYHMVNSYFFRIDNKTRVKMFNNQLGQDLIRLFKADTLGSIGKLDAYHEILSTLKKDKKIPVFK